MTVVLRCPECGSEDVYELISVLGHAEGGYALSIDGAPTFTGTGHTTILWDTQEIDDPEKPAACLCGWQGSPSDLVVPDA
jgi:hypothetical protein